MAEGRIGFDDFERREPKFVTLSYRDLGFLPSELDESGTPRALVKLRAERKAKEEARTRRRAGRRAKIGGRAGGR